MTSLTEKNFYTLLKKFLEKILNECEKYNVDLGNRSIDHVCYRVKSEERYHEVKKVLQDYASLLIESEVGGRNIATYKLNKPLVFKNYYIDLLELPAPKKNSEYEEGFEHIEAVATDAIDFKKRKAFNSEKKVTLDNFNLKWHYQSLESVIHLEKNSHIYRTLIDSKLLRLLTCYDPVVAGTFPLRLGNAQSDLDILLGHHDLNELVGTVERVCKPFSPKMDKLKDHFTCYFEFQGVPFEIYGEEVASVKQRAFKHFQVEDKLLRVGSPRFYEAVVKERSGGLKTEPAFAKVLGLAGDPYEKLLDFHLMSDREIYQYLRHLNNDFVKQDVLIYD